MERKILYIGIIIVLLIIGLLGVGFFAKSPQVSVSGATINSFNLSAIGLIITLAVDSPYPVAIPLKTVNYSVTYIGKQSPVQLATGDLQGIILSPGYQEISIPVLVSNPAIIESLLGVLTTRELALSISGNITPDFFGIAPAIPFQKEITSPINAEEILSGIGTGAGKMLVSKILGI